MPKFKDDSLREVDVIAWAMPRIAAGHYAISDDERGRELWVNEFEPTLEEMEGELCHGPDQRITEPLQRLKKDCSWENLQAFFKVMLGEKLGDILATQFSEIELTPADYPLIVAVGYRQFNGLIGDVQRIFARAREGLSVSSLASLENKADPRAVSVAIVKHYANEISNLFPRMIRRAELLRILTVDDKVPPEVKAYLEEASKCYIYGRFIACLIVCRSAVEFALRDRLIAMGHEQAIKELKDQREESLSKLIWLAKSAFPKLRPALADADRIRRAARDAVHIAIPESEVCKNMYIQTRGLLAELYSFS